MFTVEYQVSDGDRVNHVLLNIYFATWWSAKYWGQPH